MAASAGIDLFIWLFIWVCICNTSRADIALE
jgi:hypothetical protein